MSTAGPSSKGEHCRPLLHGCSRRGLIAAAAALGLPLLAGIDMVQAAQTTMPTSRRASASEETYAGDEFGLDVAWDPNLWQIKFESRPGTDGIALVDSDADLNDPSADTYFLQAEYQTRHLWATVDDMKKNSMFEWFSEGMRGSTVIEQWDTADAHGWFHTFEAKNGQTLNYIEYSAVNAHNSVWRYIAMTIDSAIFDADQATSLFEGVTVDDGPIPRAAALDELIELFEEYVE